MKEKKGRKNEKEKNCTLYVLKCPYRHFIFFWLAINYQVGRSILLMGEWMGRGMVMHLSYTVVV